MRRGNMRQRASEPVRSSLVRGGSEEKAKFKFRLEDQDHQRRAR